MHLPIGVDPRPDHFERPPNETNPIAFRPGSRPARFLQDWHARMWLAQPKLARSLGRWTGSNRALEPEVPSTLTALGLVQGDSSIDSSNPQIMRYWDHIMRYWDPLGES